MAVTDDRYGADEIQVLEGLEPVRLRPGMYVGGTGQRALHHLVWEVVDNAVDEALAGHCTTIGVEVDADGVVTVRDDGRGIPVGVNRQTGVSALELVFTRLHAGGKFGAGGYKVSGGLHGVGASVTNALSAWLEVEVRREGHLWRQRYERGVRVSDVERVRPLAPEEGTGTTVRWRSDDTIFDAGAHLAPATLAARLREKAYLVRGLEFRLRLPGHDEQVFRSERGLADYVRELNEEREAVHPNVVSLYAPQADVPTEVALGWTTSSEERVYSFCNVVNTVDGGTHVSGLRRALTRCLNLYAWETGRLKRDRGESLEPKDVFEGLTAALSVMLENPQFEGQTKGRLNNGDAQAAVQAVTQSAFTEWLAAKEHAAEARAILERCLLGREIRLAKGRISKKLRNAATSIFSDSNLPGKLADTLDNPAVAIDDRELFVVEGDSAGGCFVGETEVRLASGRHLSMRALAEDWRRGVTHFGYATNAVGDVRVVPLVAPRVTRRAARLVEVALDNGQTVRCTPDHRFRLRDGSYAAAEALRPGTSLMPLKVSHTDERAAIGPGYELVWMNGRGAWWHTHHLADLFNVVTGVQRPSAGPVRHHVDFDKRNNDPRNLVRMGQSEHLMLHAALASAQLRRLWQDPAYRARKTAQARTTARRQWQDPTYRETMCARLRELRSDPVYTRRVLDGFQRWWADRTPAERSAYNDRLRRYQEEFWAVDAHRAQQADRTRTFYLEHPEAREQRRADALAQWRSPDLRRWRAEETRRQWADDAFRARAVAQRREWWVDHPEHRAVTRAGNRRFLDSDRAPAVFARRGVSIRQAHRLRGLTLLQTVADRDDVASAYEQARVGSPKTISFRTLLDRHYAGDLDRLLEEARNVNCKVVCVTPLDERADVYDLTVDRYHNFALSAGVFVHNSAKAARDASTQAILPIRGKILNVLGAKNGRAFDNAEVDNILVALGGRKDAIGKAVVATLEPSMRRYGKVVITADADADGAHIANLLVTLFHELFPRFLSEGRLFLARPPLYRVALPDSSYVYVHSDRELQATLKRTRRTGEHVTRFKGLGEMNADQLRETVFEPSTRRLLQISMEDAALVAETVNLLMGSQAGARRSWLEGAARDVEVEV